jgi:lysozyme family protein
MAQFILAFQKTIENEGGYGNDPDDPGGETFKGIARKINGKWEGWPTIDLLKRQTGFPANADRDAELRELVGTFYLVNYWNRIDGDSINNQLVAESIFDFAVNVGVETSVELAQKTVGSDVDGAIGPNTLKAINAFDPAHFVAAFAVEKIRKYIRIIAKRPTSKKYFTGWVIRAVNY